MAAVPVTPAVAGHVNSGQRAAWGRSTPFSLARVRAFAASRSRFRGELKPRCLTAAGNALGSVDGWLSPTFPTRSSGVEHARYPPRWACAGAVHLHLGGACSASRRPLCPKLCAADRFLGNSVGAFGSVARGPAGAAGGRLLRLWGLCSPAILVAFNSAFPPGEARPRVRPWPPG